ncbi:tail fiber protein [uncultured Tateyamaria sp.]|uniref:phage tail protein n=1 Tax=Tateyamaria sp. 1078 TaxID=3417464 RepID=UPI002637A124|nr:tail fiber protein [uncultured Tateyamaria sp.]
MKLIKTGILALALAGLSPAAPAQAGSDPMLGDIMIVGFNFCPRGWARADGQILPINENQSLYSLLGTTYGGDGRTSFGLPDLRSRHVVGTGVLSGTSTDYTWGQRGGTETVNLNQTQLATHNHMITALPTADVRASSNAPSSNDPTGKTLAKFPASQRIYATDQSSETLMGDRSVNLTLENITVTNSGASQAETNIQPILALTHCIALQGLFPSRN